MITAGALFFPQGIEPEFIGTVALGAQVPLGTIGLVLALIGILFAVGGAAIDTCFSGAYNLAQYFGWEWGKHRRPRDAPRFTIAWVVLLVLALLVIMTGIDPVMLTEYAVIFSVVALPLTYVPILLVANDTAYMGRYVNGRLANAFGLLYLVMILVVAVTAIPLMLITHQRTGMSERARPRARPPRPPARRLRGPALRERRRPRAGGAEGRAAAGDGDPRRAARLAGTWPARSARVGARHRGDGPRAVGGSREDRLGGAPEEDGARASPRPRRRQGASLRGMDSGLMTRLSDLLGTHVHTESGDQLGRVHDLRAELTSRSLEVTGLVVGELGLLERLGIGAPESGARIRTRDVVPWSAVVRADRRAIVVRDGTKPK